MNYQREYMPPRNGQYYRESDQIRDVLYSFRDLMNAYNETMIFHHRSMDAYHQNINHSLGILHVVLERMNQTRYGNQNDYYRQPQSQTQSYGNNFRGNPSWPGFQGNPTTNDVVWPATNQRRSEEIDIDISSLIYLFLAPIHQPNNSRQSRQLIPLTNNQLLQATELVGFDETMNEMRCPISLDEFTIGEEICRIRGCGHYFKKQPITQWFEREVRCPVCRYDLRDVSNNIIPPMNVQRGQYAVPRSETINESQTPSTEPTTPNSLYRNIFENIQRNQSENTFIQPLATPQSESEAGTLGSEVRRTDIFDINTITNQLIRSVLLNQMTNFDSSNNLLYSLDIPTQFTI